MKVGKKRGTTNLAIISKEKISFYEGKEKIVSVGPELEVEFLQQYRVNPRQVLRDIEMEGQEPEIEMTSLPTDVYTDLMNKEHFLDRFVLKGLTMDEWMEINYSPDLA